MTRGSLRIYLGAAPGVGKTFAMLNEGWRRRERGTDVVIGWVETHGRIRTAEQIRDLEIIPRATIVYRGQTFEEMDLDAILARRPQVALVDELAHTNVPGSRNEKRWQDVAELLDAGITVISTLNIQHLESLNDVVERITGIRQRETIPDAVVRAAEQIELVDATPEALRRRMVHGNIYGPDKIDAALSNYFRPGNLAALRELALLWVADRVEESLQEYRERHGISAPWETRERVAVALTGAPGSENLIRRAARIAGRAKAELVGIHVRGDDGLAGSAPQALADHRRLLEELGGTYREVVGSNVAKTLVQAARAEGATQLVLGASRRSRWVELTRGSVIGGILREAGRSLDVHIISTGDDVAVERPSLPRVRLRFTPLPRRRQIAGFALAFVGLPLLTVALTPFRDTLGFTSAAFCYLLVVVATATIGGVWPAGLAGVGGFALLNWFFAPPIHTLTIANTRDIIAVVAFLVVAGVISALVDATARRSAEARRARSEAQALAAMAGSLLREDDPIPDLLANLVAMFRLDSAAIVRTRPEHSVIAHAGDTHSAQTMFALPLGEDVELRIAGHDLLGADRDVLAAFAAQLALALESRRLQADAARATILQQADELRSALLAAVSHDLRTPLASIKTSASSLLSESATFTDDERRTLLETIENEADRLNDLVGNLLDLSRIQAGALVVKAQNIGLEEVIGGALSGIPDRGHTLKLDVPETLPRVHADPALLERAIANIVDNALTFAPPGEPVRIEAGAIAGRVDLRVVDTGPGIPPDQRDTVLQPFQRLGDSPNGAGVGLGLAVARGFVEAMGGELSIDDTPGGGTTVVISLRAVDP